MPKISVLMPIYNTKPEHLKAAIESILLQTYEDFEFLILNDSPQNTELDQIVASFNDERIKYFKNETNMGISASRNKLMDLAQGEYLAVMDHDDISLLTRFEKEVKYLDEHPYVGVCGSLVEVIETKRIFDLPESDFGIKVALTYDSAINHSSSMLRKSVLVENNIRYEAKYSPCEDYMMWFRLMEYTQFHNIQEQLLKYRWHEDNTSHRQNEQMLVIGSMVSIFAQNKYPALYQEYLRKNEIIRIKLFNCIPLLKIVSKAKNDDVIVKRVHLFNIIPLLKLNIKVRSIY